MIDFFKRNYFFQDSKKLLRWGKYPLGMGFVIAISACVSTPPTQLKQSGDSFQEEPVTLGTAKNESNIKKFSELDRHSENFQGWYPWIISPNKKKTGYRLDVDQGKTVLRAEANSSASGLAVPLQPKDVDDLQISWSWKALGEIATANNTSATADDAPLRLMLAFDGDKSKLSLKEQMASEMASLISGQPIPYATLMYIWSAKSNLGSIITNAHTSRVRMLVVDSREAPVGMWRFHSRNIAEDFQKVFGENPGPLIGVGVLTDTDNTKTVVDAIYGDIELSEKNKVKSAFLTPLTENSH